MNNENTVSSENMNNTACINFDAPAFGTPKSERETAAFKLRQMMEQAERDKKCTLCKAAEMLEKQPVSSGFDWAFPLFVLLFSGFGGNTSSDFLETFARSYAEILNKENEEKEKKT